MKLIRELNEEVEYITEASEDGKKNLYIKGIFLQSNIKNRNGRVYPESVMDKEVGRYIKESVERKGAFGELTHPATPVVNLKEASHIITELKKDGYNYIGCAKIMETPMGNVARGILESGGRLGVSSRGLGTIKKNSQGINEVQSDFRLSTAADIVGDPSAPDAFVEGVYENVEWFQDAATGNWMAQEIIEEIVEDVKKNRIDESSKLHLFERFMKAISKIENE